MAVSMKFYLKVKADQFINDSNDLRNLLKFLNNPTNFIKRQELQNEISGVHSKKSRKQI